MTMPLMGVLYIYSIIFSKYIILYCIYIKVKILEKLRSGNKVYDLTNIAYKYNRDLIALLNPHNYVKGVCRPVKINKPITNIWNWKLSVTIFFNYHILIHLNSICITFNHVFSVHIIRDIIYKSGSPSQTSASRY